jgi:long-chain acyl-CoA synthetase
MLQGKNEKVAILTDTEKVSYGELKKNILNFSKLFDDISESRIAIFSENRLEWIYAFYSIWNNRNIPVPIDYMSGIDDVSFILNDCQPEVIFCSADRKEALKQSLKEISYEPRVIVFEEIDAAPLEGGDDAISFSADDQDTAVIIYTSGTTGSPKGVMLTFENLKSNIIGVSEHVKFYTPDQVVMMLLPLHHIFPLLGSMVATLYVGATVAMAPSLNADDIIRTLQKHKVTMLIGVPRLYSIIHKGIIDKINQSGIAKKLFKIAAILQWQGFSKKIFNTVHQKFGGNVKYLISGGAPLDPEVAVGFRTLGFEICEGYGMTESAPMITFTRPGKFFKGSAGQALPGTKIEIRDGEIVASGKNIMKGYYKRQSETDDILRDGWLYTGDLGHLDSKGRIFITGRKKEIIVLSNGKNINPAEIELKVEKLSPLVKEAAVFMMNDKLNLVIVPDEAGLKKEKVEDAQRYFRDHVLKPYNERATSSKRLLKLHISAEELPKTRLSKIQRFKLVDFVETIAPKEEVVHEKADSKELETIIEFISQQIGQQVYPEDRLIDDLALDSLAKITLIVYLENTFGVEIPEQELVKFERVRDLSNHILAHKTKHKHELINWTNILKEKVNFSLPKAGMSFNFSNFSYKAFIRSILRLHREGINNIPDGPCIIAANHQSFLDGFLIASSLKRKTMRHTYFYAKESHWKSAIKRFLARKNNVILMDVNRDLKTSLQKMAAVLRKGKNLIIFPEGTRSEDGSIGQFKQTFAILARELNVPIVPVAISGAHVAMPRGSIFPRLFKRVSIKFMKPVYPEKLSYDVLLEKVQKIVAGQVS